MEFLYTKEVVLPTIVCKLLGVAWGTRKCYEM